MLSLNVVGSGNTFASCSYYAPRGTHTVQIAASAVGNCLHGSLGLGAFGGNLEYKGILLIGPGNIIDVTNVGSGCVLGAIDFGSDMGNNFVRVNGYQPKGSITFGTPHVSDDVLIAVTGITGQNYSQQAPVAWVPFVPVISSIVGAISTVSASGRYKRNGKTIHFQMSIFVTANGTGSGGLVATLPANALSDAVTSGRENSTGKMVQGQIQSGTALMRLFDYANNYPATSGTPLVVSGTYETV